MTLASPEPFASEEIAWPFAPDPASLRPSPAMPADVASREAPFLDEYFAGDHVVSHHPERETFMELLDELYDDEFDHLLAELAQEAYAAYESSVPLGEADGTAGDPEGFVRAYLAPLEAEAERIIDEAAAVLGAHELAGLSEGEMDGLLEGVGVPETGLSPLFEQFLGGLVKKIKKTAKKAWSAAKSVAKKLLPINVILGHVKKLVRPMLERVLKYALNKLPPTIRPIAATLAKRFLGEVPFESEADAQMGAVAATADVGLIQEAFDAGLASALLAGEGIEGEVVMAEAATADEPDSTAVAELARAREAFIREVTELPEGADPTPAVERFLPAVLPFVRMGISIIGRPRVVNFLAGVLAGLIQKYVGRNQAMVLSRAIADAGLRMLSLEAPEQDTAHEAGAALAATIEDTVRELGELDPSMVENESALQAAAMSAFSKAAGVNFPPALLKPAVRRTAMNGVWALGPPGRARAFKKFSRRLGTRISPWLAKRLPAAGGASLHEFLNEQYEADGDVEAVAHLYEAVPGTRLPHVAAADADAIGLDASETDFHPLTQEAAAVLFGEPGLASEAGEATDDPLAPGIGERFYFLEVKAARRPAPMGARSRRVRRRPSQVRLALHPAKASITLRLYLSETRAQEFASRINRGASGPVAGELAQLAGNFVDRLLAGGTPRRLRLGTAGPIGPSRHRTMRQRLLQLASVIKPMQLGSKIAGWLSAAMSASPSFAGDLAKAAGDQRIGITVVVQMEGVQGVAALAELLAGKTKPSGSTPALGAPLSTSIRAVAGSDT